MKLISARSKIMKTYVSNDITPLIYIYEIWLLPGAVNKLHDLEERIRRTEDSSKENKSALGECWCHNDTQLFPLSPADQPHQERGEGRHFVPAGHGLQEGAAGNQVAGALPQTGLSTAGKWHEAEGSVFVENNWIFWI